MSKVPWEESQIFFNGDDFFNQLLKKVDEATNRIWFEVYIFEWDRLGQRIADHLKRAQKRGVQVQVLVDGIGSYGSEDALRNFFSQNQIKFRVFHPLLFEQFIFWSKAWKFNKRTHRKIFLIDDHVFLGSFNISQTHCTSIVGESAWRDTGVLVKGPMIQDIAASMLKVWNSCSSFFFRSPLLKSDLNKGLSSVRTNLTLKDRYLLSIDLKKRIRSAQSRVLLTTAYFLPRRTLLRSLVFAAKKGCFVGLCLPQKTDVKVLQWASRGLFRELLKSGIKIYEYLPSVMHAKTVVIDDWIAIGSHNWNHRSLNHDLEIEVTLTSKGDLAKMLDQWDRDVLVSEAVTLEKLDRIGLLSVLLGKIIYWFRYWL